MAAESLVQLSSVRLSMNSLEDEDFYAQIKSRMAHLAIIDVLAVGVALSWGPDFQMAIKRSKQIRLRSVPV